MTERIPCKEPGCTNTILPSTGESTGGICMPCHGRKKKAEWDEYVRKNKKVTDPFEGVSDPIEIVKIFHTPRKHDPLLEIKRLNRPIEEVYAGLTPADANRLMMFAIEQIRLGTKESIEMAETIAEDLTVYTQFGTKDLLRVFAANDCIYPGIIFSRADESVRDTLLRRIADQSISELNHILCALAWIGDTTIVKQFAAWKTDPPRWEKTLYIPAHRYSIVGGWELDSQNERRDLFFQECHALSLAAKHEPTHFQFSKPSTEKCLWCNAQLSELLSIDTARANLSFLKWIAPALTILSCPGCFWFGPMFTKINPDGTAVFHPKTPRPKTNSNGTAEPFPTHFLKLQQKTRSPFRGARAFDSLSSQIGGHSGWLQDSVYPTCPDCSRTMKNFAQIIHDEVERHYEGTFYFYLCTDCHVTALEYQST